MTSPGHCGYSQHPLDDARWEDIKLFWTHTSQVRKYGASKIKTHYLTGNRMLQRAKIAGIGSTPKLNRKCSNINIRFQVKDLLATTEEDFLKITFPPKQMLQMSCGENTGPIMYKLPKMAPACQESWQQILTSPTFLVNHLSWEVHLHWAAAPHPAHAVHESVETGRARSQSVCPLSIPSGTGPPGAPVTYSA